MMTRTVVAFEARTPVVLNAPPSTQLQMLRAEAAAATAVAAAAQTTEDAATTDADRIAAAASAALADTNRGLVEALMAAGGNPYPNAYATALPRGVTSVTIGGTAITGATVGEYPITGSGGSITGYDLTLVVTSATTATVRVNNTGLGSGTTPPTLTKPAGATLPAGTTLTAVVAPIVADQKAYAVASSDSATVLVYRNNAGAVAALNNPDGTQISFLNAREFRRFIAWFSTWRNTAYAVANPHLLRVKVNLVMTDGSTPPDCYVYDIRRDLSTRCVLDIKRVSDNLRIGALGAGVTIAQTVAPSINPTTQPGANGGIGQVVLPIILTAEAAAAGFSSASNASIDFGGSETWGGVQDGTTTNHVLNAANMGLDAAARALVSALAKQEIAATSFVSPFAKTCADDYLKRLIPQGYVEGGDVSERYVINYRTAYFVAGSPDKYFVNLQLYDTVTGVVVATWNKQGPTDFTGSLPGNVFLTQAALGSALTNYAGVCAMLWIDWSKIDWTKTSYTTYTTYAQAGIKPEFVASNEQMDGFREAPKPAQYITFGNAQADFPTYLAAVQSTYKADLVAGGLVTRSTFPISDICSYSRQVAFVCIQPGYTETITPVTLLGVDQSPIVLPPYSVTVLMDDTVIQMTNAVKTAPVIEAPWSCMVIGGTFYQVNGSGYVFHVDSGNELSKRSVVTNDDALCRFRQRRVWRNTVLKAGASACVNALVGAGVSNAAYNFWDGVGFYREGTGSGGDFYFSHTSTSATDPGTDHFRNCWANDGQQASGASAVSMLKSHSQTIKNRLVVDNCDFTKIENGNTAGGSSGWVRVGKIATGITYPSTLDPY